MAECLGISQERALQIAFIIGDETISSTESGEGMAGVFKRIYSRIETDNERAFAIHHLTSSVEKAKNSKKEIKIEARDFSKYPALDMMEV